MYLGQQLTVLKQNKMEQLSVKFMAKQQSTASYYNGTEAVFPRQQLYVINRDENMQLSVKFMAKKQSTASYYNGTKAVFPGRQLNVNNPDEYNFIIDQIHCRTTQHNHRVNSIFNICVG